MNIIYRTATWEDYPKIMDFCHREQRLDNQRRRKAFKRALYGSTIIVAYDGEYFAGFVRATGGSHSFQCELMIEESYRNQGLGTQMVSYLQNVVMQGLYHVS